MCILVTLGPSVIEEIKRIIRESEIAKEDDKHWPPPDRVGRQELEIKLDREHISFTVSYDDESYADFTLFLSPCIYLSPSL
jgi:hypothetical protein